MKGKVNRPGSSRGSFAWIQDQSELEALARRLRALDQLALDSESNSGFAYNERLCLLQVNAGEEIYLIDLVEIGRDPNGLEPLRDFLEDPQKRVLIHGGEFDVGCLKRDYRIALKGVWDSQQAASFLGWEKTGYGAVVERVLGIDLPKNHAHYDWSKRPIEGEVLQYAINDVRYLPAVYRFLQDAIQEADLNEEANLAFQAVEEATWNGGYQPEGFWNLRGIGKVPAESRPLLYAIYQWRDGVARQLDLPAGRALNTEVLLALARNPPATAAELKRLGLPRRISQHWATELVECVRQARRNPPKLPERPKRVQLSRSQQKCGDRLKRWRRQEAKRRGVPLQVVLPLVSLKYLQSHGAADLDSVPQLGDKRIRMYGRKLQDLCAS